MVHFSERSAAVSSGNDEAARITDQKSLASLERLIVEDFPTPSFAPYTVGQMFPATLLLGSGAEFYGVRCNGKLAGGCMTMTSDSTTGIYWVVINREFRGRGLGRKLIAKILHDSPRCTVTLTATPAGEPLYRALGFDSVIPANWWKRPS
ncbi:GNAT family N-acetyltransferase [Arthrobacter sp. TMN-49]